MAGFAPGADGADTASSGTPDAGTQQQPDLIFGGQEAIVPSSAFIHSNETFSVQWFAYNKGPSRAPAFTDLLVITQIAEGCPGSDDQDHPVVYNSETDGNPQDYLEQPLDPQTTGELMQPMVGPFPAGSYRLTVTLGKDLANVSNYACIDITDP